MDPHVHCTVCGQAIELKLGLSPSGEYIDAEIGTVLEPGIMPGPDGKFAIIQRPRPSCLPCIGKISSEQERQKAASRLVVVKAGEAR